MELVGQAIANHIVINLPIWADILLCLIPLAVLVSMVYFGKPLFVTGCITFAISVFMLWFSIMPLWVLGIYALLSVLMIVADIRDFA